MCRSAQLICELCRSAQLIFELCRSAQLRSTYIWGPSFLRFAPCRSAQLHICTTPPKTFAFGAQIFELCRSAQLIFELCRSAQLIELCRSARILSTYIWGPSLLRFAPCPSAPHHVYKTPPERLAFGAHICELCKICMTPPDMRMGPLILVFCTVPVCSAPHLHNSP